MGGKAFKPCLLKGADHDDINHTGDDAGGVFNRFGAAQLGIARGEVDDRAAQLIHTRFKRNPGTGAGFFKYHGKRSVMQGHMRFVALEFFFNKQGAFENVQDFFRCKILELQKVPHGAGNMRACHGYKVRKKIEYGLK